MSRFNATTPMLKTADMQATIRFYVEILGFEPDVLWPDAERPSLCILDHGDASIMFSDAADWDAPGSPPTMTGQIVFDVSGVAELHERIRDRVEVLWGPEVYEYGRREFSIRDPNGYRLVFSEPTSDPPECRD